MSKEISADGRTGTNASRLQQEEDQQVVDVDLCPSNHLPPHLLASEGSVDMTEVSAYVSPCSSTDASDQSREDREILMAHLESGIMRLEAKRV